MLKNIGFRLITAAIAVILIMTQTLSAFADDIPSETGELPVQTEPTMWVGQTGNGWCTVPSETGENSAIYTKETPHSGCRAYHTIGYALFLTTEEKKGDPEFRVENIDEDIEPLFYFPSEGVDEENIYKNYNVAKYINLEKVAEKFKTRSDVENPYTRRLFLTPIITYRNYTNKNVKADSEDNYADLVKQIKRDDDDIFTLDKLLETHKNSPRKIESYYSCNDIKFDYIKSKGSGWSASSLLPYAAFHADTWILNEKFSDVTIGGKARFAPYNKCKIYDCLPKGKSIQSFAPGQTIPIIEPEEIEPEGPSVTGPLPILTYTSFPANNADGKSGDPIPDSAIAINGEYYFANKAEQPE